jgi:hypothetical protein
MGNASLTQLPASPVRTPATPEQYNAIINALLGMLVIRDPTTGLETDGAYDIGEIANGRPRNIYITGDLIKEGQIINVGVPIGIAFPYFSNITGVPTLPSNFWACNGQQITDVRSAMYGQYLPDINVAGRFVRGSLTAGVTQTSQNKSHTHTLSAAAFANHTHTFTGAVASHTHGPGTLYADAVGDHVHAIVHQYQNLGSGSQGAGWQDGPSNPSNTQGAGSHGHTITTGTTSGTAPSCSGTTNGANTLGLTGTTDASTAGSPDESRPVNISALWVMRIY